MAAGGGCFLGASLSCTDLLVYLYARSLDIDPDEPARPDRDYLFLSKGHDVPALYGTLAELGFFPVSRLERHLSVDDALYWHPNRAVPGVEFHSGSLGHLLSVGIGVAYDLRLRGSARKVVVLVGDGELNEGSIWEALLVAGALRLGNLVVVVDRNGFQANLPTEALVPLEPLAAKFEAFGCLTVSTDGHDFGALDAAFAPLEAPRDRPAVVVARTVRGKGVPSIEARADRWFCRFTDLEVEALLRELHGASEAALQSEALLVR
ncbi:MAG: transketolase [Gemmatimonadales bacterium]|nr:transketolase [Gemmatimonadales bacterium]